MDALHGYRNPVPLREALLGYMEKEKEKDKEKENSPIRHQTAPTDGAGFVNLVITPYKKYRQSVERQAELEELLKETTAVHSIPDTHYQSRFYEDPEDPLRFYHIQTSPWDEADMSRMPAPCDQTEVKRQKPNETSKNLNHTSFPKLSLSTYRSRICQYAEAESSNGRIKLGMPRRSTSFFPDTSPRPPTFLQPTLNLIPFDTPYLAIGTRTVPALPSIPTARSTFADLSTSALSKMASHTAAGHLAAGWVEDAYSPISPDTVRKYLESDRRRVDVLASIEVWDELRIFETWVPRDPEVPRQTFKTLSGWMARKDYDRCVKMMARNLDRGSIYGASGPLVSPKILGEKVAVLKKIA